MDDRQLMTMINEAKNNNNHAILSIHNMFKNLIYKNSITNGMLDSDSLQELAVVLIICIRRFDFKGDMDIRNFIN